MAKPLVNDELWALVQPTAAPATVPSLPLPRTQTH